MGGDSQNYNIYEIGQNIEKSPGELRRIALTGKPSANANMKNSQGLKW